MCFRSSAGACCSPRRRHDGLLHKLSTSWRIRMTRELFDKLVAEALDQLPEEFREKLENVEVIVEDFADLETLRSLDLQSKIGRAHV